MITTAQIEALINDTLEEKECFVVDLDVRPGNNILLEVDSFKGVTVNDCITFSRAIEHNLDREIEDFELHVSSPGLDKPFKVKEQFYKNIGRNVKVVLIEGKTVEGELKEVNEEGITLEYSFKQRIEGKKKKEKIVEQKNITFNNIKETTIIISFKK